MKFTIPQLASPTSLRPPASEAVITSRSLVELFWQLQWRSDNLHHIEELFTQINVWRDLDLCPAPIVQGLHGKKPGDVLNLHIPPGNLLPAYAPDNRRSFPLSTFAKGRLSPRLGRFYPQGLLRDIPYALNLLRCVGLTASDLTADFNHPLSGHSLDLDITVVGIQRKKSETGGQCQDWLATLLDGPGQQIRWQDRPTDFFPPDAFQRPDDHPDAGFYAQPRFVSHLDAQARETISRLYGCLLQPGMRVLDLMSSWQSHLPEMLKPLEVVGLGLNEAELRQNPRLTGHLVHDLNQNPVLPSGR